MKISVRQRVLRAALAVPGVLCVTCGPVEIPHLPVSANVAQARMRGRSAPEPDKLAAAVIGHVIGEGSRAGHRLPPKVCVGVSAGLIPPGWEARLDSEVDWSFFADADVSSLQRRYPSGPTFEGISACGWEAGGDAWVIVVSGVERWWDTPDEYDVFVELLWWAGEADGSLVCRQNRLHYVAVHSDDGWRVVREGT